VVAGFCKITQGVKNVPKVKQKKFAWPLQTSNDFTKEIKQFYVFKRAQGPSNNHNMKNHRQANNQITGRAGSSSKQGKEESKFNGFVI
jgi:hypothetical protein